MSRARPSSASSRGPSFAVAVFLSSLLGSPAAFAQDDEPIPYDDEPAVRDDEVPPPRVLPKRSKTRPKAQEPRRSTDEDEASRFRGGDDEAAGLETRRQRAADDEVADLSGDEEAWVEERGIEENEKFESYGALDDPNTGLGLQLFGGLALVDSSRGGGVDARPQWGARFIWEFGRALFSEQELRDALFADLTWSYVGFRDGTTQVFGDSNLHYFTLAPAWTLFFDPAKTFGLYGQAGAGVAYQFASFHVGASETAVSAVQPLIQYGVGLRGRPLLGGDSKVRLSFRVELTRFRRGYLDDTLIAGSLGGAF